MTTNPILTDPQLAMASDVIDAITAATTGDRQAIALFLQRLTPEQVAPALAFTIGMAAGTVMQLADLTRTEPQLWIERMRQMAAS